MTQLRSPPSNVRETGKFSGRHSRLTSGLHSPEYLQCAKVLQHPGIAEKFGSALGAQLPVVRCAYQCRRRAGHGWIDHPGHEVARAIGCRFIFTERDGDGKMTLRRGFAVTQGEHAVVIEDVITTGGSLKEVVEILKRGGAVVSAAGSIIDRSGGKVELGVPRVALAIL